MSIFEDKIMFNTIKEQNGFENRDQWFLNLIQKELQKEENKIALESGRPSAKVILDYYRNENDINSYNIENNTIELFCKDETEPIEYLDNLTHESTHANEHHSKHYSIKQKELFGALTYFQIEDDKRDCLYTCNLTEIISKTAELKQLLEIYNKYKNNITDIRQGLMFYQAFKNQNIFVKSINFKNIELTKITYFKELLKISEKKYIINGLNKNQVITNYILNINKEYLTILKEFNKLKTQYKQILKELSKTYDKDFNKTDIKLKEQKEKSNIQKEKEINKLDNIVNVVEINQIKNTEEKDFYNFNKFKEFIKNHKNQKVCIIYNDYENDIYRITYEKQEELQIKTDKEENENKEREQQNKEEYDKSKNDEHEL